MNESTGTVRAASLTGDEKRTFAAGLRRWIVEACQGPDGAFHAWRDASTGELAFAYPEITGYALTHLASLPDMTEAERAAGDRAGAWLVDQIEAGDLAARPAYEGGAVYNFDVGMIAAGLLSFGRRVGDAPLVDLGRRLVEGLVVQIVAEGRLSSVPARDADKPSRSVWSTTGHAHLMKVVQCFLLAEEAGMAGARDRARQLVHDIASLQRPDGRFVTHPDDRETMLHPHLYAAEGLYMWGRATDDAGALDRSRAAVEWAFRHQLPTGGLPRYVRTDASDDARVEQMDLTAQAARLGLAFALPSGGVAAALARLLEVSETDERGSAVLYQPEASRIHLNTWATLFAAQAMHLAGPGAGVLAWRELV